MNLSSMIIPYCIVTRFDVFFEDVGRSYCILGVSIASFVHPKNLC